MSEEQAVNPADNAAPTEQAAASTIASTPDHQSGPPATLTVSLEEYQRLTQVQKDFAETQAKASAEAAELKQKSIRDLADKGKIEEALNKLATDKDAEIETWKSKAQTLETEQLSDKKKITLTTAFAGVDWVNEYAKEDALATAGLKYEAVRNNDGTISVVDRITRRPAADVIKEYLVGPASAHLRKASTQGGTGTKGADMTISTGFQERQFADSSMLIQYAAEARKQPGNNPYSPSYRN